MMKAICQGCKKTVSYETGSGWSSCLCTLRGVGTRWLDNIPKEKETGIGVSVPTSPLPKTKKWSNAVKTPCGAGHRHGSKMEARVCDRLRVEWGGDIRYRLIQKPRLALYTLVGTDGVIPYITPDFGVYDRLEQRLVRLIEAKNPKRISRDWPKRAKACEESGHPKIEEVDK